MQLFGLPDSIETRHYNNFQSEFLKADPYLIIGFKSAKRITEHHDFVALDLFVNCLKRTNVFKEVHFITNVHYPRKKGAIIKNRHFLPLEEKTLFEKKFRKIWSYPDITEKFISKDGTAVCLYASFKKSQLSAREQIEVNKVIDSFNRFEKFTISSTFNEYKINDLMKTDTLKMSLISFSLIVLFFFLFLRSAKKLLFFTWELLFCVGAFYFLIDLLSIELNLLTISIPIIIITLSLSDTVHIISALDNPELDNQQQKFSSIKTPLILTTLSTIAGFLIFIVTNNSVIIEFALLATAGLVISFLIARFWSQNLFWLLQNSRLQGDDAYSKFADLLFRFNVKHSYLILIFFAAFSVFSSVFIFSSLKIDSFQNDRMNKNLEPGRSVHFYQENFSGPRQIELFIQSDTSLLTTSTVKLVDSIENYLIHVYGAKSCQSINTILKRQERFLNNGAPDKFVLPDSINERVKSNLLRYRSQLGLDGALSSDLRTMRVVANSTDFGSKKTLIKNKRLALFLEQKLTPGTSFYIGGPTTINDKAFLNISDQLSWSILFGIFLIVIFLVFYCKSVWIGLAGGIVNTIPLLSVLLFYSVIQRNVGPNDLMLLCILLGVAIDDSVHFLSRLGGTSNFIEKAFRTVFAPTLITSMLLIGGFSSLLFSFSPDNQINGVAFIIGFFTALLCDLILLPALILIHNKKKSLHSN